jgi:hypothetical protein
LPTVLGAVAADILDGVRFDVWDAVGVDELHVLDLHTFVMRTSDLDFQSFRS